MFITNLKKPPLLHKVDDVILQQRLSSIREAFNSFMLANTPVVSLFIPKSQAS